MTDKPHCLHEEDFGRIDERSIGIQESLKSIEAKLDKWNGIPVKVNILWKYNWVLFLLVLAAIVERFVN